MGIFVSYSHDDKDDVSKIVDIISTRTDEALWYDKKLRGGDLYFSVIAREISENDKFLFVVSKNSVTSNWCLQELQFAMSENKKIIAVWLENIEIPIDVKFIIQNTHYVLWNRNDERFADEIIRCFSRKNKIEKAVTEVEDPVTDKYFITKNDAEQIIRLLKAEKENKYSICFESENAILLGFAYELGIHTEKDLLKASFYYQVAKFKKNTDAQYFYASLMLGKDPANREQYLQEMKDAAEQGGFYAMTAYGDLCYDGRCGTPQNQEYAIELWKKAAELGSAEAQYYMAYSYSYGDYVEKNDCLALMYALNSVEHEFPRAYRILGTIYEYGKFVNADLEMAKMYFKEAIARNDYISVYRLGCIYYFDEKNYSESVKLFRQAVDYADEGKIKNGNPYLYYGMSLFYGDGIEEDKETAIEYYFKAVEKNCKRAKQYIADRISEAYPDEKGIELLKKACRFDCSRAEYKIAQYYLKKKDLKMAVSWFKKGAGKGCADCLDELIKTYSVVLGDKSRNTYTNRKLALKYYQLYLSLAGEKDSLEESLHEYYYSYAMELSCDEESPDIDLAVIYFEKALKKNISCLGKVIWFAVEGFLFNEVKFNGLKKNVENCEKILNEVLKYVTDYHNTLAESTADESSNVEENIEELKKVYQLCKKGYIKMSEMYRKGEKVEENKEKADKYRSISGKCFLAEKHCVPGEKFEFNY